MYVYREAMHRQQAEILALVLDIVECLEYDDLAMSQIILRYSCCDFARHVV